MLTPHSIGKRILLVEDDVAVATGLSFLLEDAGCAVDWASSGSGVMERIRQTTPDLVMLDVELGDADGRDIYRHLRNESIEVPVILMSGRIAMLSHELDAGSAFLRKPFDSGELLAAIGELPRPSR
jgi:two-component system alkaline phosphatase synthesis response regulator PhoP